jgi:nucleoside-diphosphate-sugar epimerase
MKTADKNWVTKEKYVCLVTGAAGFIGSHLTKALSERPGHFVVALDNLSTGTKENIEYGNSHAFEHVDFTDPDSVDAVFKKYDVDFVFHLGALPRVQFSISEPLKSNKANVDGTLVMLNAARHAKVRRFVFSSSSSVYGDQTVLPLYEDMKPNPLSPYALQKLTGETYARQFYKIWGLETISLRYFNVFGPRQQPNSSYAAAIPKFAYQIIQRQRPTVFGDGEQTRDFTYVSDVVGANITSAWIDNSEAYGEAFNIGGGNRISVNNIVGEVGKILGVNPQAEYLPPVVESKHTMADISKAKRILGWVPKVSFEQGLYKTVNWIRESYDVNS